MTTYTQSGGRQLYLRAGSLDFGEKKNGVTPYRFASEHISRPQSIRFHLRASDV